MVLTHKNKLYKALHGKNPFHAVPDQDIFFQSRYYGSITASALHSGQRGIKSVPSTRKVHPLSFMAFIVLSGASPSAEPMTPHSSQVKSYPQIFVLNVIHSFSSILFSPIDVNRPDSPDGLSPPGSLHPRQPGFFTVIFIPVKKNSFQLYEVWQEFQPFLIRDDFFI